MKSRIFSALIILLTFFVPLGYAEDEEPEHDEPVFTQQELDQMLAPIALYPDALLSQILMAATYPAEVAEAARWSDEHAELQGEAAVSVASQEDWDASVVALTAFPRILAEMEANPEWTEQLGDAFLNQQEQVMDTVQHLRREALAAGYLESNDKVRVLQQGDTIIIEQASPQIVYVPYYNPQVVYGSWRWDAYPPVFWDPWPGYNSGFGPGYYWGSGIPVGLGFFYSNFDWHRHYVRIHPHHYRYSTPHHSRQRLAGSNPVRNQSQQWRHDPLHRRNVPYAGPTLQGRVNTGVLPGNQENALRPGNSSPVAPMQAPIRPQTRQDNIATPNPRRSNAKSDIPSKPPAAGMQPHVGPARQINPRSGVTIPAGSNIKTGPARAEVLNGRDNRSIGPATAPQTRALVPKQNPITAPRQPLTQPQPMRRFESSSARMSARGVERQQQVIPPNRDLRPPQHSMPASGPGQSAKPRNFGSGQQSIGNNPPRGNHRQSGGEHSRP